MPRHSMKLALIIVSTISLLAIVLYYSTMEKSEEGAVSDMPWQVTVHDSRHSEVFGIVLNKTTLEQARQRFDKLDGIALFQNKQGKYSLEAYFGKVSIGPFGARLIANLDAPQEVLEGLTQHTIKRIKTKDGSYKWTLTAQKQVEQGLRKIRSLTYIPDYSGIDVDFILERFGQPDRRQKVDETTEILFYSEPGVRIMVDSEGKELFEYSAPAQFNLLDEGE